MSHDNSIPLWQLGISSGRRPKLWRNDEHLSKSPRYIYRALQIWYWEPENMWLRLKRFGVREKWRTLRNPSVKDGQGGAAAHTAYITWRDSGEHLMCKIDMTCAAASQVGARPASTRHWRRYYYKSRNTRELALETGRGAGNKVKKWRSRESPLFRGRHPRCLLNAPHHPENTKENRDNKTQTTSITN